MTHTMHAPRYQLVFMLAIAAATTAAFWASQGPDAAIGPGVVIGGFALLVYFGRRRSDTLEVMSGIGDERTRALYTRAVALTGTVLSLVLPAWWLVTVARFERDTRARVRALRSHLHRLGRAARAARLS